MVASLGWVSSTFCFTRSKLQEATVSSGAAFNVTHLEPEQRITSTLPELKKPRRKVNIERTRLEPIKKDHVVEPIAVSAEHVHADVSELVQRFAKTLGSDRMSDFQVTIKHLLTLALTLDGGAGFVCAPCESYDHLQQHLDVDINVVDSSERFPDGYMTKRLCKRHVSSPRHQNAVRTFAQHTDNDRWPEGHEAADLPKDGYTLYGAGGFCRLAAARLIGLPMASCKWENVGMRHTTALQLCWALRGHVAVVVVRSDSGGLHVLCPGERTVDVLSVKR